MAASNSVLFDNLLNQNEALTTANLQLQHEVNASKKLQFRQEILGKQLEARIKELEDTIKTQAADYAVWAAQVEQVLVTVNEQVEEVLTRLRARSTRDEQASLPQSTPAIINEQRIRRGSDVNENLQRFMAMASKEAADMDPTHRAILEEALLDCNLDSVLTAFGKPNVQPQSAVQAYTTSLMRPESAPFVPAAATTKVPSPTRGFKGSLENSIHAVPLAQRASYGGFNTAIGLNRGVWPRKLPAQSGPGPHGIFSIYDEPNQVDDWLETLTSPSKTVEHTQRSQRIQLSSTAPEDDVPIERGRSLRRSTDLFEDVRPSQSNTDIHPERSQVELYSSKMLLDTSNAKSINPLSLSSVLKAGRSIHAPPSLVSNDKSSDRPISTQISSLDLPQPTKKYPTEPTSQDKDKVSLQPSNSAHPREHDLLNPFDLPTQQKDRDVTPLAVPSFDPSSSILESQPGLATAFEYQATPALEHKSLAPGASATLASKDLIPTLSKASETSTSKNKAPYPSKPSAALTYESLAPTPSKQSQTQTSTSLMPTLSKASETVTSKNKAPYPSTPSAALTYDNLAPTPSKQSQTQTSTSLAPTPAIPSPANTYKGTTPSQPPQTSTDKSLKHSEPSSALTYNTLTPSEPSPALTYKGLDNSKPSHILFEEMMSASKAFSEQTEAQRKAAMDKPVEEGLESLSVELPEELRPTYTRVLGSALDARSRELVLKPSTTVGRLGLESQPVNRPLHLKFERVLVTLLLPSGAIKRLGHLDRPAMANAEICMHMYISETEATSITLVARIHSTGNDFLVLTATQARPLLEFNVNFMLPGQLNQDTMTFNTVLLNEQDDFSATSSVTSEIENLREPITQRLKGCIRHMSFAFSHDNFNMLEQEDLPNAEDFQEHTTWDPEALTFFDFMRSFTGTTRKVITLLFTDEKHSTVDVDDMITTVQRNCRNKILWRDNGVNWEGTLDANGNRKWTLASSKPEISRHL